MVRAGPRNCLAAPPERHPAGPISSQRCNPITPAEKVLLRPARLRFGVLVLIRLTSTYCIGVAAFLWQKRLRDSRFYRGAGRIGAWDLSSFDAEDMAELLATPGGNACQTNQVLYSLKRRWPEDALLPADGTCCAADGLFTPGPQGVGE